MNENHFDFNAMINSRFIEPITKTKLNLINSFDKLTDYKFWDFILDLVDEEKDEEITQNTWDLLPQCIKKITEDEKFLINNELSVAFLHGTVTFPLPGISSPHLHGYFNFSGRKPETGYLSLDNLLNRNNKIPKEKAKEVMDWLQHNNPLYKDFTPLTFENIHFRINPSSAPMGSAINMAMIQNTSGITNDGGDVFIRLKKQDGTLAGKFIPLEKALPLCFPILFPSGKIEKITGKTLREKARFILSSHPFLRCGRLACHLVLFLYSIIMDHDTAFIQNGLSIQRLNMPIGANRNSEPDKFRSYYPSSPIYWSHRQAEVRAMCSQFGDPDLIITFTFVNKWNEVSDTEKEIGKILGQKLDIRFCTLEEMEIWKKRFLAIKKNGFQDLLSGMNLGVPIHYTWTLKFQARGAPHVHSLIWLEEPLDITKINKTFFAQMPNKDLPIIHSLVHGPIIHSCNINRCKKVILQPYVNMVFLKTNVEKVILLMMAKYC